MARRKAQGPEQLFEAPPIPMLPPPRKHHPHPHDEDPYETPVGASPTVKVEPIRRPLTPQEETNRNELSLHREARALRYEIFLTALAFNGGNKVFALAQAYALTPQEAEVRQEQLLKEIHDGVSQRSISEIVERYDVGTEAQVAVLRKHLFSDVPAASLKAVDLLRDISEQHTSQGSFEEYLRLAKQQALEPKRKGKIA